MKAAFFEEVQRLEQISCIPWDSFKGKTIFITGATGLIGTTLIYGLDRANFTRGLEIKIIALTRNLEKARERFNCIQVPEQLTLSLGNVEAMPELDDSIDYIVHAASQTAGREMIDHAVETIQTTVLGTMQVMELAKKKKAKTVFLSSMEVYGNPEKGHAVNEQEIGALSPLNLRNSYPISKILSESLCCAYATEYGVPVSVIRLAQTFGNGVRENDTRVFAYFAKCVLNRKEIVLKSKGDTERCYLHVNDAVSAILTVLAKGEAGQAYNAADESTYCSIAEMAQKIAQANNLKVVFDIQDNASNGFPQAAYLKLDVTALRKLGWSPESKMLDFLPGTSQR